MIKTIRISKLSRLSLLSFSILVLVNSCKEPIDAFDFEGNNRLVIDGFITDQLKVHEIRLSYSSGFEDGIFQQLLEEDASVYVEDDLGARFEFQHTGSGRYQSAPFSASADRDYQLFVQVGEEAYSSSNQRMPLRAAKADIRFERGEREVLSNSGRAIVTREGVVITANMPSANSNTYYHWVFENYHQYISPDFGPIAAVFGDLILESFRGVDFLTEEQRDTMATWRDPLAETCYLRNIPDPQVVIHQNNPGTSTYDVEIDFINRDQSFIFDYAIRSRQLITDEASFRYWNQIKQQFENVGSLFDAAASSINGNIVNRSTGETSLGYFGVYREYFDLFFFNDEELGFDPQPLSCRTEDRAFLHLAQALGPENEEKPWGDCISCLERGGALSTTHRKPDWWR